MTTTIFTVMTSLFSQVYNTLMTIQFFGIPLLTLITAMLVSSIIVGVFGSFAR